jgi:hypothetical protein
MNPPRTYNPPNTPAPGTFGGYEQTFYCTKCNKVLGHGTQMPDLSHCPGCGVRFSNTPSGSSAGAVSGIIGGVVVVIGIIIGIIKRAAG